MSKLMKRFSAIGLVGLLALSLSGCGDKADDTEQSAKPKQGVSRQMKKEKTKEKEEEEEVVASDVSPGELSLMIVDAALGNEKDLADYGSDFDVTNVLDATQQANVLALEMLIEDGPSPEQLDALDAAVTDAFSRVEVEVVEEEESGSEGSATVAIYGVSSEKGTEIASEDPNIQDLVFGDMEVMMYEVLLQGWVLAPVVEEPYEIEFEFNLDPKTGRWVPADEKGFFKSNSLMDPAITGKTAVFDGLKERL